MKTLLDNWHQTPDGLWHPKLGDILSYVMDVCDGCNTDKLVLVIERETEGDIAFCTECLKGMAENLQEKGPTGC